LLGGPLVELKGLGVGLLGEELIEVVVVGLELGVGLEELFEVTP
jgi:hypothetical protein